VWVKTMDRLFKGAFHYGVSTATANTAILRLVEPRRNSKARVTSMNYRSGSTAHTLTIMKPVATTTAPAGAAASQADIVLETASPVAAEALAASDYLAWENADGGFNYGVVSSVSGNTVTLAASLTVAIPAGALVWAFYEVGRATHQVFSPAASVTTLLADAIAGVTEPPDFYQPLLIHSNNATAQSWLVNVSGYHAKW
jgi:hypothetical protein